MGCNGMLFSAYRTVKKDYFEAEDGRIYRKRADL